MTDTLMQGENECGLWFIQKLIFYFFYSYTDSLSVSISIYSGRIQCVPNRWQKIFAKKLAGDLRLFYIKWQFLIQYNLL